MIKNQKRILIPFLLIILIGLVLTNFYEIKKSNVLLAVFDKYSCDTVQGNVSTISKLNVPLLTLNEAQKEAENVLANLDINSKVQVDKNENDSKLEYIITRNGEDTETTVTLTSNKNENGKIEETYLTVNTILYEKLDGLGYVQTLLDDMHKKLGLEYSMNITVVGRYKGNMGKNKENEFADKVLKSIKARKVDSFETDNIYSVYGYTKYIKDFIVQSGNKVNVNLAMRYNSYEDKTYLYISTPIITTDY